MTVKLSQLSNTRMDVDLLKFTNADAKWNVTRKNRTSMTRRPRKPGAGGFEWICRVHEPTQSKKVVDGSKKKRRLLHQSTSKRSKTPRIKGEDGMSHGPQTPITCYEDFGQRCWPRPLSKSQKEKNKSQLKNSKTKKTKKGVRNTDDFSGIALLADVACSISVQEAAHHVGDFSMSKEHIKPEVKISNACGDNIKEGIVSPGSNGSAIHIQQNVNDIGTEVEVKKVAPSKGLRLHWDLNTVMDDWEDPCDDMQTESAKHEDTFVSVAPLLETCNVVSSGKTYDKKTITVKTSDVESFASKSEAADSLTHPARCEDFLTSPTSVLKEQSVANCETDTIDGLKLDHQRASTEVIHMAEGEENKIEVDYDSPFEDGELREPIEKPEKKTVCIESDNVYTDEFGTIGNSLLGKLDHGQTVDNQHSLLVKAVPKNDTDQGVQVDAFERPHIDEPEKDIRERKEFRSTSFDVCRNGEYLHRSRSSNIGDSTMREYDLKSYRSVDRNYSRNYNSRGGPGGGYRTQDRRPSPPGRNNGYGSYRGPPPARSQSRDRYRYHSQEYHDPKPHFTPNFSRPSAQPRSRSRSRSGSPIAWNFQKRKNPDTNSSGETKTGTRGGHVSPDRSSKCFDDHHRFKDGQFRDKRQPSVTQRYDTTGHFEKQKPDDYYRFNQRGARFSQMNGYKYKDNSDDFRKHDGYYDKGNRVGRSVDDGVRRFRYDYHNRE